MSKFALLVGCDKAVQDLVANFMKERGNTAKMINVATVADAEKKMVNQLFDLVIFDLDKTVSETRKILDGVAQSKKEFRPHCCVFISAKEQLVQDFQDYKKITSILFVGNPPSPYKLGDALNIFLTEAPEGAAVKKQTKVDVNFINPFIKGTLEVLKITANVQAVKEQVYIRGPEQISGDISAIISMNSLEFMGSMAICFEKNCFLYVVSQMLGEKYTEITKDNQDAVGEICNQVFGMAKRELNEKGHSIAPAIPSIVIGDQHIIKHMVEGTCLAVRFVTEEGTFTVEAILQPKTA